MFNLNRISKLTPEQLELLRKKLAKKQSAGLKKDRIKKRAPKEEYPLSSAQRRLWFLQQMEPDSAFYNIPSALRLRGPLQLTILEESFNRVIARHEILRAYITIDQHGEPRQKITPELRLKLNIRYLEETPVEKIDRRVKDILKNAATKTFDLTTAPLLEATVIKLAPDDHILLLNLHHIIADGWSLGIIIRELILTYRFLAEQKEPSLAAPSLQYTDYTQWQIERATTEVIDKQMRFWRNYLKGMPTALELFTDFPRPPVQMHRGAQHIFNLNKELTGRLRQLAQRLAVTPFALFMTAVQIFLYKISGQEDFGIGAPIANRNRRELEDIIGFFVNTIVLRATPQANSTFETLAQKVQNDIITASDNQDAPFDRIVDELVGTPDLSRSPLFQVMFDLQQVPFVRQQIGEIELSLMDVEINISKFDLLFLMTDYPDTIHITLEYNSDLFKPYTIELYEEYFTTLLSQIAANPAEPLAALSLCNRQRKDKLIRKWQQAGTPYPGQASVTELFEEQVSRSPEKTALYFEGKTLSYRQLDEQANQLAHYLIKHKLNKRPLMALFMERSPEVIISILAILKAGAAYLPLDPNFPQERLAFILQDTQAETLLSTSAMADKLPDNVTNLVLLDKEWPSILKEKPFPPGTMPATDDLIYVMYTSGSTGKPKGVSVRHRGVARLVKNANFAHFGHDERFLQLAPVSFDASTLEIWGALLNGAMLTIMPPGTPSLKDIADKLLQQKITFLWLTAGLFHLMVDEQLEALSQVKQVLAGGDILSVPHVRKFLENKKPDTLLINGYGPTENTTFTCCFPMKNASGITTSVPIGRPINQTQVYILDELLQPVPPGIPGELYIGGSGLARDYINRPALTAEKFLPNPFATSPGERMYCTGDLVRQLPDGNIEFLGRIDTQVKIRGFRIELAEIEISIKKHPAIKDALVTAFETSPGDKSLVAYLIAKDENQPKIEDLKNFLAEKIPSYMIPAYFMFMDAFPLNINGKIDRKALAKPNVDQLQRNIRFIAPRNQLEAFLAAIWKDVLGVDKISVYDNFFDLGGNSLKAAVLVNRLQEELHHELHVGIVFQSPRIAEMAMYAQEYFSDALAKKFGESINFQQNYAFDVTHVDESKRINEEKIQRLRSLIVPLAPRKEPPLRSEKNPPAVFLLSPPRSGSTLLRIMLAGNERLFSPPELDLLSFNTLGERYNFFSSAGLTLWLEATVRALMELRHLESAAAETLMRSFEMQNMSVKDFYYEMQRFLNGRLLVDKTPSYPLDAAILQRAEEDFDQPFYIHLVRHPYAMIYSFIEAKLDKNFFKYQHPFSRQELAEMIWIISHQNILSFLQDIPAERQLRLRFEDILRKPEAEIRKLCAHLNIDFQWEMLEPYQGKRMTDGIKDSSQMVGDFKFYLHKDIDSKVAEKWRKYHKHDFLSDIAWNLAEYFGYPVEKEIIKSVAGSGNPSLSKIEPIERKGNLPLSFAQQRLWFLEQMEPGSPQYNIPGALRISGNLQPQLLQKTLNEIIKRHESLRTIFMASDSGKARQVILPALTVKIETEDIRGLKAEQIEIRYREIANREAGKPFDLTKAPLLRARLIIGRDDDFLFVLVTHHIISDGWSVNIFIRELAALYNGYVNKQKAHLPPLPVQYVDFAAWQRNRLNQDALQQEIIFWKEQLKGMPTLLDLPLDFPRTSPVDPSGKRKIFHLPADLLAQLHTLSRQQKGTLYTLLLTVFEILLYRCSGQEDFGIGTPVANRMRKEIEPLIGFFVNTLVLRASLNANNTFVQTLEQVRQSAMQAFDHQDVPFEYLVDVLQPERDTSHSPLFQVMFSLHESEVHEIRLEDVTLRPFPLESGTAKFDLMLEMVEHKNRLVGIFEYRSSLFREETIDRLIAHFTNLLKAILNDPQRKISQYKLMDADEINHILRDFNALPALAYPKNLTLPAVFERQAMRTPQAMAVSDELQELTFTELNKESNRLAHYLMQKGVNKETVVAVYGERNVGTIISILAILKAGGAYLPVDPSYPPERVAYMLEDSGAAFLLVRSQYAFTEDKGINTPLIALDKIKKDLAQMPAENPDIALVPENLAYIIYTSGSTGKPKGVMIQHRSPLNLAANLHKTIYEKYGEIKRRISLNAPLAFDASVQQIVMMMHGHHLVIIPQDVRYEGQALLDFIRQHKIELLDCVPSQLKLLIQAGLFDDDWSPTDILPGGEAIDHEMWHQLQNNPKIHFYNMYGPTECTVDSTMCPVADFPEQPTIGRPAANTRFYVLDDHLQPLPLGVAGELHIAGDGLGRGYLNRPELTAEKFIPDPFSGVSGARMYKTGDLACFNADGSLTFKGRLDYQVKLRGFRIELGEIESALRRHPAVEDALVMVREDTPGHQQLTAYFLTQEEQAPESGALRRFLDKSLPEYMIPVFFVPLTEFPLTPNGKIDRKALPLPAVDLVKTQTAYVAPTNKKEKTLARIWQEILHVPQVGIHNNFFEMGGDSILSIQVIARAKREGLQITPRQLFENPTIEGLAAVAKDGAAIHAEQGTVSGSFPATPIQRHFFEQRYANEQHWNQSLMLKVQQALNPDILQQVLAKIMEHHDALRLRVKKSDSGKQLYIEEKEAVTPFTFFDLSERHPEAQRTAIVRESEKLQAGLDLNKGPIMRAAYFSLGDRAADRLLIIIHHLAIDGVSWRILTEDIQLAYAQAVSGQHISLPPKSTSFKYWAESLAKFAGSKQALADYEYWKQQIPAQSTPFPVDFSRGENTEETLETVSDTLSKEETHQLLHQAPHAYNTQINELLLTALAVAFKRWSGKEDLLVAMEGHGREDIIEDADVSRTVGWFTSLFPVYLNLSGVYTPAGAIKRVKEHLRRIPQKGLSYGLLRYLSGNPEIKKTLSRYEPQVVFNYLGQFERQLNEAGAFEAINDLTGAERSPKNKREFILDISGSIKNGQLLLQIAYSSALHKETTIREILMIYMEELKNIIAHCISVKSKNYTPSDFTDVKLEEDEISDLLDELE